MKKLSAFSLFNFRINTAKGFLQVVLFVFPFFCYAISSDPSLGKSSKDPVIYISSGTMMVGGENIYNATIVEVSEPKEDNATKNVLGSKRENSKVPESLTKKNTAAAHPKPAKPKHIFTSTSSNESFGASNALDNKNSVCNPTLVVASFIVCQYTKLSIASYIYLLNIYSADFSKIAELSQFRFSRPPPMI